MFYKYFVKIVNKQSYIYSKGKSRPNKCTVWLGGDLV